MPDHLNELIDIELHYAHFNAHRTCSHKLQDSISLNLARPCPHLIDPGRQPNTYYNRSVLPPTIKSADDFLAHLPSAVAAVEQQTCQQALQFPTSVLAKDFVPGDALCYLHADPNNSKPVAIDGEVLQLRHDQTDHFFDLLAQSGVTMSQEKRDAKREYYCTDQFRCFVAYTADKIPAAWATMYVNGNAGFFANAFTLPEYRRNGFQSALLAKRMTLASELNIQRVFTDVVPMSQSHANCLQAGFQFLTGSLIWSRAN